MPSVVAWYLSFTTLVFLNVWFFFIVLKIPCLLVYGCHFCLSQSPVSVEYSRRECWWIRYIVSLSPEWERIHPAWPLQPKDQAHCLICCLQSLSASREERRSHLVWPLWMQLPPALWKFPRTLSLLVSAYAGLYFFSLSLSSFFLSFSPFLSLSHTLDMR